MTAIRQQIQNTLIAAFAVVIAATGAARADDTPPQSGTAADSTTRFARIAKDLNGRAAALQLAIVTYVPKDNPGKFSVDLVSAVHIGDNAYYAELNDRFRRYDALLYELIAPEGMEAPLPDAERKGFISNTQLVMKSTLDLKFQLDEIDYGAANFVHADLSPVELRQSMADRGESLYVYFWRIFYASIDEYTRDPLGLKNWRMLSAMLNSEQDNALKIALAYELTKTDRVRDMLDDGSGSAVIGSRNQRAMEVLREQLESGARRIGIFYGAAHMPDFEERLLTEIGLVRRKITWIDAWQLKSEPAGIEP